MARILIVDPDKRLHNQYEKRFESLGHEPVVQGNVSEAISLCDALAREDCWNPEVALVAEDAEDARALLEYVGSLRCYVMRGDRQEQLQRGDFDAQVSELARSIGTPSNTGQFRRVYRKLIDGKKGPEFIRK